MKKSGVFLLVIKIIVLVLLVALLGIAVFGTSSETYSAYFGLSDHSKGAVYDTYYFKPQSKKAMILIPGLMASTMFDVETNDARWGYTYFGQLVSDITKVLKKSADERAEFVDTVVNRLACDENNIPKTQLRVGNMSDDVDAYGAFQGMIYLYRELEPLYGKQYDIVVWQYDWRQSNTGSALELEKFIHANKWEEVMFFTHSMGGNVVSNFLARSEENRDMTKLFMPFGCPFFGSMDAINNLFENENSTGLLADALGLIKTKFGKEITLASLARTLASVYELLPANGYDDVPYFDPDHDDYVGSESAGYMDNVGMSTAKFNGKIKDMKFTKKSDGTNMPVVATLTEYFDHLYVDYKGKKTFVSDTVPTEYIVGVDVETTVSASVGSDGMLRDGIKSMLGDGTVPAYSASAGHALTDSNVHLVYGISHGPLANDLAPDTKDKTGLKYLKDIMKKYIAKTDAQLGTK